MTQSKGPTGATTDILVAILTGSKIPLTETNVNQIAEAYKIIYKAVENPTGH